MSNHSTKLWLVIAWPSCEFKGSLPVQSENFLNRQKTTEKSLEQLYDCSSE